MKGLALTAPADKQRMRRLSEGSPFLRGLLVDAIKAIPPDRLRGAVYCYRHCLSGTGYMLGVPSSTTKLILLAQLCGVDTMELRQREMAQECCH